MAAVFLVYNMVAVSKFLVYNMVAVSKFLVYNMVAVSKFFNFCAFVALVCYRPLSRVSYKNERITPIAAFYYQLSLDRQGNLRKLGDIGQ